MTELHGRKSGRPVLKLIRLPPVIGTYVVILVKLNKQDPH